MSFPLFGEYILGSTVLPWNTKGTAAAPPLFTTLFTAPQRGIFVGLFYFYFRHKASLCCGWDVMCVVCAKVFNVLMPKLPPISRKKGRAWLKAKDIAGGYIETDFFIDLCCVPPKLLTFFNGFSSNHKTPKGVQLALFCQSFCVSKFLHDSPAVTYVNVSHPHQRSHFSRNGLLFHFLAGEG